MATFVSTPTIRKGWGVSSSFYFILLFSATIYGDSCKKRHYCHLKVMATPSSHIVVVH
jgi:hypothetical protein